MDVFFEHLLCARHSSKPSMCINVLSINKVVDIVKHIRDSFSLGSLAIVKVSHFLLSIILSLCYRYFLNN